MRKGFKPNRQQKPKEGGRGKTNNSKNDRKNDRSGGAAPRKPMTGFRAEFAKSLRGFINGPKLMHKVTALPSSDELVGFFEVIRLMNLFSRFHENGLLVSKTPLRPIGFEEHAVDDSNPASMDDWIGVIHSILGKAGSVLKSADLFTGNLRAKFLKSFPSPGPLLKHGISQGVLFTVKIPGCVFVQLSKVDLTLIDGMTNIKPVMVSAAAVVVKRKADTKKKPVVVVKKSVVKEDGKGVKVSAIASHAPIRVIVPLELVSNQAPAPDMIEIDDDDDDDVDDFDDTLYWVCGVCEQQNDKMKFPKTCEVCLIDKEN